MFWFVYVLDKSLSLRLGRSSTLQDYDITLELPGQSSDVGLQAWDMVYNFWIDLARFNGRVYEQLYSARALSDSETDRVQRAKDIIRDMQSWYQGILSVRLPGKKTVNSTSLIYDELIFFRCRVDRSQDCL